MPDRRFIILGLLTIVLTSAALAAEHDRSDAMRADRPTTQPAHTNRLIDATSPYLQQHAHNPVDWYEWGDEALARARREDKPIFLSIGYSACHWCHVMAHESFENEAIAAVMNAHFVNIKVDREERPDLDELYMRATVIYTRGQGGWPMSVWLTPELEPFAAGTYFPPEERYGRPGFKQVCEAVADAWENKRADVERSAATMTEVVRDSLRPQGDRTGSLTLAHVDQTAAALADAFDSDLGGLLSGPTNKFPPSTAMQLMLRTAARQEESAAREKLVAPVRTTLDKMAAGGIRDHLAGGFARYSTDPRWHVPHFEKMLYDQALVARAYLDGYQFTHDPNYAAIAREICDYVLADLQAPSGGFYSARDADSEGVEGKYYVWTRDEIVAALGEDDGKLFCAYYDVRTSGNWDDPHAPGEPKNVLHTPRALASVAGELNLSVDAADKRLEIGRKKLLDVRGQRVAPSRDEKILCEWNGLMIATLARVGAALDQPQYVAAARRAAEFILKHQYEDGRLLRSYRDGQTTDEAFLTDYAALIDGLLNLYEATFERHWFDAAVKLNAAAIEHYWDDADGGFFFTADDHEKLLTRTKEATDGATPSGNSLQLLNLIRLHLMTGDDALRQKAETMITVFGPHLADNPGAGERFMAGVDFLLSGPREIVVVGDPADAATRELIAAVHADYVPSYVLLMSHPAAADANIDSPLLKDRPQVDGQPTAYVCQNGACQRPVTTAKDLKAQLTP